MSRLRQLNPLLRVSSLKDDVLRPYRHAEDIARYAEGLRQAGLPESLRSHAARTRRQGESATSANGTKRTCGERQFMSAPQG